MRKAKRWPALLVLFILVLMIAAYIYVAYRMVKPQDDIICNGVFVESIDLSGMTREQAEDAIQEYIGLKTERLLEVDVNGKKVTTSLKKIGYECEASDCIDQALRVGKSGNPFANYVEIKEAQNNHIVYDLTFKYSDEKIQSFVKKKCGKECTKAKNSKVKMQDGALTYTEAKDGITIDTESTMEKIKKALQEREEDAVINVSAEITVQEPAVTEELASRCKDKIGTFRTVFNAGNVSRSKNVANAARLINGKVLNPGETFSVHDAISPMTEDNGYYAAPSYNNGKVEDSIGGGVCQVSTTLYNAVLRAELEIVERSPHSMVVTYVEPSMDAAIAGDYKDFKFRNNTQVPIYIEGGTYSGNIYFNLYGEETRSKKRKVTFESETIETMQPGADKITYDKTKPTSYTKVEQEAHVGYRAVLWKVVKENGKEEKTQINSSTYQASPRYVTKGSMKATPKPTASPKPSATPKGGDSSKKATPKPKATPEAIPTTEPTAEPVTEPEP